MSTPMSNRHVAESAWFWLLVFTGSGFTFLALMQPRIAKRQAQIENKYQNRRMAEEYRRSGRIVPDAVANDPEPQAPTNDRMLLVAQWPLMYALGAITLLAGIMLWRRQRRFAAEDRLAATSIVPANRDEPPPPRSQIPNSRSQIPGALHEESSR